MVAVRELKPFLPDDLWQMMKKYGGEYNLNPVRYARRARAYWLQKRPECFFCGGPFEQVAHKIPHTQGVEKFGFNSDFLVMLWNTLPTCKRDNALAEWKADRILQFTRRLRRKLGIANLSVPQSYEDRGSKA